MPDRSPRRCRAVAVACALAFPFSSALGGGVLTGALRGRTSPPVLRVPPRAPALSAAPLRPAAPLALGVSLKPALAQAAVVRPVAMLPAVGLAPSAAPPTRQPAAQAAARYPAAPSRARLDRLSRGVSASVVYDGAGRAAALSAAPVVAAFAAGGRDSGGSGEGFRRREANGRRRAGSVPAPSAIPGRTPLERHVAYFDADGDGVITVGETAARLRLLGVSYGRAYFIAAVIHAGLAPATAGGWLDALRLRIRVANIHQGVHPADTGVYDADGQFVPAEFERIFAEFAKSRPGQINAAEIEAMIEANARRRPGAVAKLAAQAEFRLLLELGSDRADSPGGTPMLAISKERLREFYEGTLLYRLAGLPY